MKKIICVTLLWFMFIAPAKCETAAQDWTTQESLNRVNRIGINLLQKNNLPTQIKFSVIQTDEVNAYASGENEICVYTGLLKFVNNDEELAGVIAHEIGHILNNHVAKQTLATAASATPLLYSSEMSQLVQASAIIARKLSLLKMSRTAEYEADVTGVDLIANAGYSPLAMVSVLYKIGGNYVDFIQTHPSCDKRTMYIYNYITYAYPTAAKELYPTDSYKQFITYATPIVDARNANPKKLAAFNTSQQKLKEKRLKKMEKYKNKNNGSIWKGSYTVVKTLIQAASAI